MMLVYFQARLFNPPNKGKECLNFNFIQANENAYFETDALTQQCLRLQRPTRIPPKHREHKIWEGRLHLFPEKEIIIIIILIIIEQFSNDCRK